MKRRLALLLSAICLVPAVALAAGWPFGNDQEIQKLRAEIAAAKLDRTLSLTPDQARKLIPVLKEALQVREELKSQREKRRGDMIKALTAIRDDYRKTGQLSEANRAAYQEARGETSLKDVRSRMRVVHERIRDILTPEQKNRLKSFSPQPVERAGDRDEEAGRDLVGPRGKLGGRPHPAMRTALTPEFLELVEARAK